MSTWPTHAAARPAAHGDTIDHHTGGHRAALASAVVVAAPLLLVVGRGLMTVPASRGYNSLWTAAHLLFLAGTVLMIPAAVVLDRLSRARAAVWLRDVGLVLAFAGACALAAQFVADLMVAQLAGEPEAGGVLFDRLQASAITNATLYTVGPALLFIGLIGQAAALLRVAQVRRWAPWALVAGSVAVGAGRATGDVRIEMAGLALIALGMAVVAVVPPRAS